MKINVHCIYACCIFVLSEMIIIPSNKGSSCLCTCTILVVVRTANIQQMFLELLMAKP